MQNKKVIQVKDCLIGAGRTKICVPLLSHTLPELLTEAEAAAALAPDLIEWRVDYFQTAANTAAVTAALSQLRTVIPTIPLIVTCRDYAEGGFIKLPQAARISLLQALLETAQIDLLDVEFSLGQAAVASLLAAAHRQGVYVIVSYHNFVQTPAPSALYDKLLQLQAVGADIVKIAVMPQGPQDVLSLLTAALEFTSTTAQVPVIAISMSALGAITRLAGSAFGSAVTFAAGQAASAPGQIPAAQLQALLKLTDVP
ncbi:MAG: type I 3-dehydroquinate dehydratase [Dethiobacteraceae bacterium]|jgi:3-dehydroquinate dehydratase-1|nr:type I 3-dehydroquinate dehydratase [Bacillota bacterium]